MVFQNAPCQSARSLSFQSGRNDFFLAPGCYEGNSGDSINFLANRINAHCNGLLCELGAEKSGGEVYFASKDKANFTDANRNCIKMYAQSTLAIIRNEDQNGVVQGNKGCPVIIRTTENQP